MKILERSEAVEATPLYGDDSFAEPKTSDKSLQMRILDPVTIRVGTLLIRTLRY